MAAKSDTPDALKREQAGTYRTADGRFTVEQSSSGWLVLDGEQADELGLPLARGPFGTLDAAKSAIADARSGAAPKSGLRAPRAPITRLAAAKAPDRPKKGPAKAARTPKPARTAPKRADPAAVVIREVRGVDGEALRALWKACGFRSLGDDDLGLARLARRNPGLVLVAAAEGRVVGSALGAWDGRRGWIYHLAVAESHRRRGIATRLVEQVEAGLRDLGCPEVRVNVGDDNAGARGFWQSRAYETRPTRQFARELDRR
jgi:ribosomal protein S18 acetylase RimI-like enzyme